MSAAEKHPQAGRIEKLDGNTLSAFAIVIKALQVRADKSNLVT
jgi:hypothetical protein